MTEDPKLPSIDEHLKSAIGRFNSAVVKRFQSAREGAEASKLGNAIAELILPTVREPGGKLEGNQLTELFSRLAARELKVDLELALQAKLANELLPNFAEASRRSLQLAELSQRSEPTPQVKKFLRRVSRCYILQFNPETFIMCRAALEKAIDARFASSSEVDQPPTRHLQIMDAGQRGWLGNMSAKDLSTKVRARGDTAVHKDPFAVGNSFETIELTLQAIGFLSNGTRVGEDT